MADLSHLVERVRDKLSNVPRDHDDPSLIYNDLNDAYEFVTMIAREEIKTDSPSYIENCTVNLAAYYNYLNYTSLAERRLGELPATSFIRIEALRAKALSCLSLLSKYPLKDDLSLDLSIMDINPASGTLGPTVLGR